MTSAANETGKVPEVAVDTDDCAAAAPVDADADARGNNCMWAFHFHGSERLTCSFYLQICFACASRTGVASIAVAPYLFFFLFFLFLLLTLVVDEVEVLRETKARRGLLDFFTAGFCRPRLPNPSRFWRAVLF